MVYDAQNYWDSGLCPSSGILNTRKHNLPEIRSVFLFRSEEGDIYSSGFLRKSYPQSLTHSFHLRMERVTVSETLCFLVFRIAADGQSPELQ
jgi:hypothetical protein